MKTHEFTLTISRDPTTDEAAGALLQHGCDDCTPAVFCGTPQIDFHREAPTLQEAIRSAMADVVAAGLGPVLRVDLPVSAEDLAIVEEVNATLQP